jgi:hypothetical protein
MAALVRFKSAILTDIGFQRSGVWGEATAEQRGEHLALMLGAMAAPADSVVKGLGVPAGTLGMGLMVFPQVWDWYVQWRERRRGFYTVWEVEMLLLAAALTRPRTGWIRQSPELARGLPVIPGLVTEAMIEAASRDWAGACDVVHRHVSARAREVQRVARIHRDPFEPILPVLEAASPVAEYSRIADEVLARMPDDRRHPRAAAEAARAFLMLRFGLHLGLRQKNLRQLLLCDRQRIPRTERELEALKRGELRGRPGRRGGRSSSPALPSRTPTPPTSPNDPIAWSFRISAGSMVGSSATSHGIGPGCSRARRIRACSL